MAVTATQARFEGGSWYSDYSAAGPLLAAARLPWYLAQAPAAPAKIAIAGAGWGHSVKALRDAGRDASGFDASSYASLKYVSLEAGQAGRNVTASVLNATQMTNYRRNTAGLSGSTKISLMVSEDLLPCLDVPTASTEITTALARMRDNATKVIHVVTCARSQFDAMTPAAQAALTPAQRDTAQRTTDPADLTARSADFNWKTASEWKRLVGTELVMNAETGAVL